MKPLKIALLTLFIFGVLGFTAQKTSALSLSYSKYDVEIDISKDSTFIVQEEASYILNGEAHGLRRDITLSNPSLNQYCLSTGVTCGGFDRLNILKVEDSNGRELQEGEYSFYEVSGDDGERFARVEWEIWPNGENVTDYEIGWKITYKVFGGIQSVAGSPYFYWNVLPENKNGNVATSRININLPEGTLVSGNNIQIFSDYEYNQSILNRDLRYNLANLSPTGNFTLAYRFNSNEIIMPGNIEYRVTSPLLSNEIFLDGNKITDSESQIIKSVEAGEHKFSVSHIGYKPFETIVDVRSGETTTLDVQLEPELWMSALLSLNTLIMIAGLCLTPFGLLFVFLHYRKKGRDENMPKTIIPEFNPPENIRPYLLGSLKDETVDKEDIAGTIIDMAYRGFIKIKELDSNKNYELTRLSGNSGETLDEVETEILEALFFGKEKVETNEIKNHFPLKYLTIENNIYKKMVTEGYFKKSPKTTKGVYAGIGCAAVMLGIVGIVILSILFSSFLGQFSIFTPALISIITGVGLVLAANYMPAKTTKGSRVFAGVLGFKMYLHTAERFRLQNLGPDEFEKYLSYAIVFKIEKEWARKFEGIYKKAPNWYEGSGNIYDAVWISSFARSFTTSTVSSMNPVQSGNYSGSGWSSGGGSFGGFSGGGGGGGSSGGW
jgi:uncharacterized membrane protein YgcG